MELSGQLDEVEFVTQDGRQADVPRREMNNSTTDIIRIKEQMSNQGFEMLVKLQAGKCKKPSEDERDLPDYVNELEEEKTKHFNKTLALHRMQLWHVISEKLKQTDPEAEAMRVLTSRSMDLCSNITALQQESCELQDQITDLQKQRLELKRLSHEQMKEMDELKRKKEHPEMEKYRSVLEKGQSHLDKYHKMATITQNVLRGVILASKVNWRDDPKLRDIAMTLEDVPLSDE
ncbi:centromere protein H [Osmerus eperlanus]|uniref:centromere protein H n=1 Tax=Osmerus eperlanus TaxID=29151 RepID=UPI002E0DAE5A